MAWSSFNPNGWVTNVTQPQVSDYIGIYNDLRTRGGTIDGGGYGRANTGFVTLVPGDLPGNAYTVTGASWASGTATLTIGAHSIQAGQIFSVSGITPTGYNTTFVPTTAVTGTTISYALASNPGSWASGGTVQVAGVSTANGMLAVDTSENLRVWNGSSWVSLLSTPLGHLAITATAQPAVVVTGTASIAPAIQLMDFAANSVSLQNGVTAFNDGAFSIFNGSHRLVVTKNGNIGVNDTAQFGSGVGVVGIANATTDPTTSPTGGGVLFVSSGALKYKGSSGTVTTIANA